MITCSPSRLESEQWQRELAAAVTDPAELLRLLDLDPRQLPQVQMAACCAGLGVLLYGPLGVLGAISAAAPLLLSLGMSSNQTAWLTAKVYYGVVWLLVLSVTYGA